MHDKPTMTVQNPQHIDAAAIRAAVAASQHVLVQFDTLGEPAPLFPELDALAATCGTDLTIRIYGYDPRVFDTRMLLALPHVASLAIDCHRNALYLEALGQLRHLKRLSLGVHEMAQKDILALENLRGLEVLQLGETVNNDIDLAPLRHYTQLSALHIEGHSRHIETLAALPALRELALYRIKHKVPLDVVSNIARLDTLRLQLGGRESIEVIAAPLLRKLEIIRVRGLERLGDMGRFPLLERLWIEDQIKLQQLDLRGNCALRQLYLLTCKSLASLAGLGQLSALTELSVSETRLDIDTLLAQGMPPHLQRMRFRTGKVKRDQQITAQLAQCGYSRELLY